MDREQYFSFIQELSEISPFYDFSGINSLTVNNSYYLETCHYRMSVGDFMLPIMFESKPPHADGFGQIVNSQNINRIIEQKKRGLANL